MDSDAVDSETVIEDLQRGGLRFIQWRGAFRFGMDSVLLADFIKCKKGGAILDLCTGTGIIPVLLTARTEAARVTGLEIQPESAEIARENAALNGLQAVIGIITGDLRRIAQHCPAAAFDAVSANPPYIKYRGGLVNPDAAVALARHEIACGLEDVAAAAAYALKPRGHFYMVHKPHRLAEIICALRRVKLEPKALRFAHPRVADRPSLVLVEAVKNGGAGVTVMPPLIIYDENGAYTPEVSRIYGAQPD